MTHRCSNLQPILDHIDAVVRPALRKYVEAENGLTSTHQLGDARQNVMLAARQAVDVLHHLSDFVLTEKPSPELTFDSIKEIRDAIEAQCVFLRSCEWLSGSAQKWRKGIVTLRRAVGPAAVEM